MTDWINKVPEHLKDIARINQRIKEESEQEIKKRDVREGQEHGQNSTKARNSP